MSGLRVWAVDDGEKIFREDVDNPLQTGEGNSVWDGAGVKLWAARNEVVAFQLIFRGGDGAVEGVDVRVSDLVAGEQRLRGSHPLPAPNEYRDVSVELFTEHYLRVKIPSYNDPVIGGLNWSIAASPKLTGWIPDALIPFSANSGLGGAPFTVPAGLNQGVWVDVYVPRETAAGTYTGTITILAGGETVRTVPLQLDVLDVRLPDENHYRSMVYYSESNIAARHGRKPGPQLYEMVRAYHRMAHRHRFELIGSGTWEEVNALQGTLDGSEFTPSHGYAGPGEGVGNTLFSINTYGCKFEDTEEGYRRESDRWVTWFEQHAPNVEYFLYLTDEPATEEAYQWVLERAARIHNNPGPGKKLPVFLTKWPIENLQGAIDIWASPVAYLEQDWYEGAMARGERYWLYAAYRPRSGADVLDDYGIAWRIKPWIAHKHGIQRWFTWESTYWFPNHLEIPQTWHKLIWTEPMVFTLSFAEQAGNGDGTFFYPGEDKIYPDQDRGYAGPLSSIRMKMYRRGIQDVEYMWLAEQAGHPDEVAALVRELLPKTLWEQPGYNTNSPEVATWSNSNAVYEQARRKLAEWIEARN